MTGSTTRARSFGGHAADYDRLRPGPHPEALDRLLPPGTHRVVDLAAGTGLVTRAVLVRDPATTVIAVEPDTRMLARLVAGSPTARPVLGTAEAIPLAAGSVDAVLASSAWHWFDADRATAEIARVLRPGGVLGLLWSRADPTVDWVAEVRGVGRSAADGSARLSRRGFDLTLPPGHGLHDDTGGEAFHVAWTRPMTRDEVAGMVCTYSGVLELPAAEQRQVFDDARARLDELVPPQDPVGGAAADALVDVPFETVARRWVRS